MEGTVLIVTLVLVLHHVAALQAGRWLGAAQMSVMSWIGLVLAVGLCVYLFVALLLPEKFE